MCAAGFKSRKVGKSRAQLALVVGTPHRKAKDGSRRGGKRVGAGRKPNGEAAMVSHARRPPHKAAHPLHISMKALPNVPNLRQPRLVRVITQAMRQVHAMQQGDASRGAFRIAEFSIQDTHVHLLVEAADKRAMSRGMASLAIRIALAIKRVLGRDEKVWRERYYARRLTVPKEVRNALVYVLLNSIKHKPDRVAAGRHRTGLRVLVDVRCTSAAWFKGFSPASEVALQLADKANMQVPPVAPATTWLLTTGWRRHGLIDPRRDGPRG
ncbi:MAG: transposase [Myxococcales bacterium]|nr:transposase [Myxococcales bacterium]